MEIKMSWRKAGEREMFVGVIHLNYILGGLGQDPFPK